MLRAVTAARKRGVKVRVMLNPARRSGKNENGEAHARLSAAGVEVIDSNPAFDITHEKSMVVDDTAAYIMSFNWQTENLTEQRDYGVVTSHPHEVQEIIECFEADWGRKEFCSGDHSHLVWCIGNGRQRLGRLIDGAKHSIWLQNERYQDPTVIEHLVRAVRRGGQGAYHGAAAAQIEAGETRGGRKRAADSRRCGSEDPQTEGPETSRKG